MDRHLMSGGALVGAWGFSFAMFLRLCCLYPQNQKHLIALAVFCAGTRVRLLCMLSCTIAPSARFHLCKRLGLDLVEARFEFRAEAVYANPGRRVHM